MGSARRRRSAANNVDADPSLRIRVSDVAKIDIRIIEAVDPQIRCAGLAQLDLLHVNSRPGLIHAVDHDAVAGRGPVNAQFAECDFARPQHAKDGTPGHPAPLETRGEVAVSYNLQVAL